MIRAGLAAGIVLTLAGCAHSSSLVLLPDEDGGHGQVAILEAGGKANETVVADANSRASLGGRPSVKPLGNKGLKPAEAALLGELPPPARSFTLYFLEGTTTLTPESAPVIDELRAEIARRPGADVQVTGHTDTVGSDADNDALSQKRAEEILGLLASQGFDRSVMSAVGRGERELKEATGDNVGNAVNRRVEVIVR
jgi:outer membrane protein OmpA-like peptidoglycan-associated protein